METRSDTLEDDEGIFKNFKLLGNLQTPSQVYSVIDFLEKNGEIDTSLSDFAGGIKISGSGMKKLYLGGYKNQFGKDKANDYMVKTAPMRAGIALLISALAFVISVIALCKSF